MIIEVDPDERNPNWQSAELAPEPEYWLDGSYSVQGAAAALGITAQTVFKWLGKGRLVGHQLTKGQPWKIPRPTQRSKRWRRRCDISADREERHHEVFGSERARALGQTNAT